MRLLTIALVACTSSPPVEPETIVHQVTPECGAAARLVRDVCTQAGSNDGCVATGDVCVALCDGATSCHAVGDTLRALSLWPIAPEGYCVVCVEP
jgi:hypothetical protein